MTISELNSIMFPDYRILYTFDEEPMKCTSDPVNEKVSVTLQSCSKEREITRAHGYTVHRSTLNKIINDLEHDGNLEAEDNMELCPFCGSSAHVDRFIDGKWYVECGYCGTSTAPIFDTKAEAMKFWNGREVR